MILTVGRRSRRPWRPRRRSWQRRTRCWRRRPCVVAASRRRRGADALGVHGNSPLSRCVWGRGWGAGWACWRECAGYSTAARPWVCGGASAAGASRARVISALGDERDDGDDDHAGEHAVRVEVALRRRISRPRPLSAPRNSPTTAPMRAKPKPTCRLARIHVKADGSTTVTRHLPAGGAEDPGVGDEVAVDLAGALEGVEEDREEDQDDGEDDLGGRMPRPNQIDEDRAEHDARDRVGDLDERGEARRPGTGSRPSTMPRRRRRSTPMTKPSTASSRVTTICSPSEPCAVPSVNQSTRSAQTPDGLAVEERVDDWRRRSSSQPPSRTTTMPSRTPASTTRRRFARPRGRRRRAARRRRPPAAPAGCRARSSGRAALGRGVDHDATSATRVVRAYASRPRRAARPRSRW